MDTSEGKGQREGASTGGTEKGQRETMRQCDRNKNSEIFRCMYIEPGDRGNGEVDSNDGGKRSEQWEQSTRRKLKRKENEESSGVNGERLRDHRSALGRKIEGDGGREREGPGRDGGAAREGDEQKGGTEAIENGREIDGRAYWRTRRGGARKELPDWHRFQGRSWLGRRKGQVDGNRMKFKSEGSLRGGERLHGNVPLISMEGVE